MTLAAQAFKPGSIDDPAYLGPLSSAEHREKVLGYYAKAVEEGATVVTGGGVPKVEGDQAGGFYVEPTLWTGLAHDSTVMREEIFGPCCGVIPFDSEGEVIALANDTDRSEEHTSELQSLMRISYAVFCLKKKKKNNL